MERRHALSQSHALSLYLHIPFCTTKCTYCAFNTYTNLEHLIPAFVEALCREIAWIGARTPQQRAGTIFFGGGTPSLLGEGDFARIFETLHTFFVLSDDAEITLEANPNDLSRSYAQGLRRVGFNRISIGMQSANARDLRLFRRRHGVDEVASAVSAARGAGFDNISLDLIYGIPEQGRDEWQNTLRQALALNPEHISLYALGIEEDTPMAAWLERGLMPAPDDDLAADMYGDADLLLAEAGLEQYEISNWAKPGRESRHNSQYWLSLPYLGLGPGGHGFVDGLRYATLLSPQRYIRAMQDGQSDDERHFPLSPAVETWEALSLENEISEMLLMGLRLVREGVSLTGFHDRFGVDLLELHGAVFERFAEYGIVEVSPTHVRLTKEGRLLSNALFRELV